MRVHLRKLKNKNGTVSLLLDTFLGYYTDEQGNKKARRIRETLPLKLPGKKNINGIAKANRNESILAQAEKIRAEKEQYLLESGQYPFFDKNAVKGDFYPFLDAYIKKQIIRHPATQMTWKSLEKQLKFYKSVISFEDINTAFAHDFLNYLQTKAQKSTGQKLTPKTILLYYGKFKSVVKYAQTKKQLPLLPKFPVIAPVAEKKPVFLANDEVVKLNSTHCANQDIKNAFLFALYTGLGYCEIKGLQWKNIVRDSDQWLLDVPHRKGRPYLYPLSTQAKLLLGEPEPNPKLLFPRIRSKSENNLMLLKWAQKAQIQHTLTFNVAKNTFVYRNVQEQKEIVLIQQLLGHMQLKTTQKLIEKLGIKNALHKDPISANTIQAAEPFINKKTQLLASHKRIQLRNYSYTFSKLKTIQ